MCICLQKLLFVLDNIVQRAHAAGGQRQLLGRVAARLPEVTSIMVPDDRAASNPLDALALQKVWPTPQSHCIVQQ